MTMEELFKLDRRLHDVVCKAVTAADREILAGCAGNPEVLGFLTAEVAKQFASKSAMMVLHEVYKKEMLCEVPPEVLNYGRK